MTPKLKDRLTNLRAFLARPAPCDKCHNAPQCRQEPVACDDFRYYVTNGRVRRLYRTPENKTFRIIFQEAA